MDGVEEREKLMKLLPAHSAYATEVVAAEHEYRDAVNAAWLARKRRIDVALTACLEATREDRT